MRRPALHLAGHPRAYAPTSSKNRREAKPLDAGARWEERIINLVNQAHGEAIAWRLAGIHSTRRATADGYVPDAGGYLESLEGHSATMVPDVPGRPTVNFLVSVKSQQTTGSAKQKIRCDLEDEALVSDMTGTVAVLIVTGRAISAADLAVFKRQGRRDMVAVLHEDEVREGLLEAELLRVARARRIFARKLGPRGGLALEQCHTERDHAYRYRRSAYNGARRAALMERMAAFGIRD